MNTHEPLQLPNVEKFREIVLWPVQLLPRLEGSTDSESLGMPERDEC